MKLTTLIQTHCVNSGIRTDMGTHKTHREKQLFNKLKANLQWSLSKLKDTLKYAVIIWLKCHISKQTILLVNCPLYILINELPTYSTLLLSPHIYKYCHLPITMRTAPKCTESLFEKVPDFLHLWPIWPNYGSNLTTLLKRKAVNRTVSYLPISALIWYSWLLETRPIVYLFCQSIYYNWQQSLHQRMKV